MASVYKCVCLCVGQLSESQVLWGKEIWAERIKERRVEEFNSVPNIVSWSILDLVIIFHMSAAKAVSLIFSCSVMECTLRVF